MRRTIHLPVLLAALLLAACDSLDVGDLNNPGLDDLQDNPTRTSVATAATGLLAGGRSGMSNQNGYVSELGILGRESYNFDPADPRFVTELLIGPLDGGSPAFGGNLYGTPYGNIRNANIVLRAVDGVPDMTDGEKEAVRGFARTIQALDFLTVINTRDENGAPILVDQDPSAEPAPIVSKTEVFDHIVGLLDGAQANLQAATAASAEFPFPLTSGYAGFGTPATFLRFNRALRARVAVYRGDYAGALGFLSESFLDPALPLRLGVYHVFSTGSGDSTNQLFDPNARAIYAHPSILTDAQRQPGGALDRRVLEKVRIVAPRTVQEITDSVVFTIYNSPSAPVPIIRNEELILLRAEANLGLNNLPAALADIDFIRQAAGGLAPYAGPVTPADLLAELLYEKRYSLLFEGGHRWLDMRRYGRLAELPQDLPTHRRFNKFPFPINECLARAAPPASGCSPEGGF